MAKHLPKIIFPFREKSFPKVFKSQNNCLYLYYNNKTEQQMEKLQIIKDLKTVIGKRVSQNQSPTGTAKLVEIVGSYCIFESLQSEYKQFQKPLSMVGLQYKVPTSYAWNAYFF